MAIIVSSAVIITINRLIPSIPRVKRMPKVLDPGDILKQEKSWRRSYQADDVPEADQLQQATTNSRRAISKAIYFAVISRFNEWDQTESSHQR